MNIVVSFESPEAPVNLSKLFWECAFSNTSTRLLLQAKARCDNFLDQYRNYPSA